MVMRRINQMNEQKIIRLLQSICFYGTAILLYGFAIHVTLFWNSRPPKKTETIFISEPAYNPNLHRIYFMGDKYRKPGMPMLRTPVRR